MTCSFKICRETVDTDFEQEAITRQFNQETVDRVFEKEAPQLIFREVKAYRERDCCDDN